MVDGVIRYGEAEHIAGIVVIDNRSLRVTCKCYVRTSQLKLMTLIAMNIFRYESRNYYSAYCS